jgi:2-dehydro-3-deoxygluconokinase
LVAGRRILVVGEGMLELSQRPGGDWALGTGGDTLNTAIHLARLGCNVAFASSLGVDAFSERLRGWWEDEGLDCSAVLTDPERGAGLYAISLDERGERSFGYWRGESAARAMFAHPQAGLIEQAAASCELLYFSLITLAILPPEGRAALLDLARATRARGDRVAFDSNYRPRLWESPAAARAAHDAAVAAADIGLPTLEDETAMMDAADGAKVAEHWRSLGCVEVVVKQGSEGCRLPDGRIVAPAEQLAPRDTSGAGDAFNAGYLAARLEGASPDDAARMGHRLAGWTIMRAGAIPARDADYPRSEPA